MEKLTHILIINSKALPLSFWNPFTRLVGSRAVKRGLIFPRVASKQCVNVHYGVVRLRVTNGGVIQARLFQVTLHQRQDGDRHHDTLPYLLEKGKCSSAGTRVGACGCHFLLACLRLCLYVSLRMYSCVCEFLSVFFPVYLFIYMYIHTHARTRLF